ncbi:MAG: hypothetical protein PUD44_04605 [Clostridiaceae bacterium]|nr:hypothetical protein [Clostridiaceae bacterium]MDY3286679.1 hypothetical protein [Eubacteriales bacterium]MDY5014629.1 hypothetical protein [Eubacteriales bacterium]
MDPKVRELLNRVKEGAVSYSKAAGKFASGAAEKARINLQIFDLNTEIDIAYKEIGKLVYDMHTGEDVAGEAVEAQIDAIDAKKAQLVELRARLASFKTAQNTAEEPAEDACEEPCCCEQKDEPKEACCEPCCCAEEAPQEEAKPEEPCCCCEAKEEADK